MTKTVSQWRSGWLNGIDLDNGGELPADQEEELRHLSIYDLTPRQEPR